MSLHQVPTDPDFDAKRWLEDSVPGLLLCITIPQAYRNNYNNGITSSQPLPSLKIIAPESDLTITAGERLNELFQVILQSGAGLYDSLKMLDRYHITNVFQGLAPTLLR